MRSAFALRINSGRIIFVFGIAERLRAFRYPIFTGGVVEESGSCRAGFLRKHPRGGVPSPSSLRDATSPERGEISLYLPADGEKLLLRGSWLRMQ